MWIVSFQALFSGFFGVKARPQKYRPLIFTIAIILYAALCTTLLNLQSLDINELTNISAVMFLFMFVYWMFFIPSKSKLKHILLCLVIIQIISVIVQLVFAFYNTIFETQNEGKIITMLLPFIQIITGTGVILTISWLSGRKRKEPMSNRLILVTFLMFVLLDTIMGLLQVCDYDRIRPILRLEVIINNIRNANNAMTLFILLSLFFLATIFIIMIIKESEAGYFQKKNAINEYFLESQKKHYESLSEANREIRRIKHDMKNHMYCMKELCESNRYDELNDYVKNISEQLGQTEHMIYTHDEIVDAIIEEKMRRAKEYDVTLAVDGNLQGLNMSVLDTCTVFSNLLDNAIEATASLKPENKKIELNIRKNKNFWIITETNPIENNILIVDNTIATSKKDQSNHGFGILNIREAVSKYDGECNIAVKEKANEKSFVFDIMIPA